MFDTLYALQNDKHLNHPKEKESKPCVHTDSKHTGVSKQTCPTGGDNTKQSIDCSDANPCLNTKPATGHNGSQNCRHVCSPSSKRSAAENGKGHPIFCAGVGVKNHRNQDYGITQQNRDHCLPPVHASLDEASGQCVGGYNDAHPKPERRDIPGRPRSLLGCGGSEILVPKRTVGNVFLKFF